MSQSDKSAAAYLARTEKAYFAACAKRDRAEKAEKAKARVRCTSCNKRFTLGAPHQQTLRREDGMDACAECVGCDNIRINHSYDGTTATSTIQSCLLRGCPGF